MGKLDDILTNFRRYQTINADGLSENLSPTKAEIKALMLDLIGNDEEPGRTMGPGMPSFQRDMLRRELRQKVKAL